MLFCVSKDDTGKAFYRDFNFMLPFWWSKVRPQNWKMRQPRSFDNGISFNFLSDPLPIILSSLVSNWLTKNDFQIFETNSFFHRTARLFLTSCPSEKSHSRWWKNPSWPRALKRLRILKKKENTYFLTSCLSILIRSS